MVLSSRSFQWRTYIENKDLIKLIMDTWLKFLLVQCYASLLETLLQVSPVHWNLNDFMTSIQSYGFSE